MKDVKTLCHCVLCGAAVPLRATLRTNFAQRRRDCRAVFMPRLRHPETMKMGRAAANLISSPALDEGRSYLGALLKPAEQSGLDIATNPKLSPPSLGSTQGRLLLYAMSSSAGRNPEATMDILYRCCAG